MGNCNHPEGRALNQAIHNKPQETTHTPNGLASKPFVIRHGQLHGNTFHGPGGRRWPPRRQNGEWDFTNSEDSDSWPRTPKVHHYPNISPLSLPPSRRDFGDKCFAIDGKPTFSGLGILDLTCNEGSMRTLGSGESAFDSEPTLGGSFIGGGPILRQARHDGQ
eukprot:Hpha_TRINITY_DN15132_c0_g5::TRINITY_DN15132_c0_g5_i1::g.129248::m.129248